MCVIAGNLIDNAMEACEKAAGDSRVVDFTLYDRNGFVYIKCANSYTGTVTVSGSEFVTSKADSEHHGLGLKSVSRIVRKYSGEMKIETEKGLFKVSIIL